MSTANTLPYGLWPSPVSAELVARSGVRLGDPLLLDGVLYWCEGRPQEKGRNVLVAADAAGAIKDVLPEPFSARSRVHEYGGLAYTGAGRTLWFVNDADQDIYQIRDGEPPHRLTELPEWRFAEPVADPGRQRLICIGEQLLEAAEPRAALVAVDMVTGVLEVLHEGHDFYTSPRLSPDGEQLVWLAWDHPDMPWDGTWLCHARVTAEGALADITTLAGGPGESIFQPEFHPAGGIVYVSDRSNWWNLYYYRDQRSTALYPLEAEFGLPQWQFGMRTYTVCGDGSLLCCWTRAGRWELGRYTFKKGMQPLNLPWTEYSSIVSEGPVAAMLVAAPDQAATLVRLDISERKLQAQPVRHASSLELPATLLPAPEAVRFDSDGETVHGLFYAPAGDGVRGPEDALPPLLVKCHGGPTGAASTALDARIRFWTSRGFAVLDVNYRGSTGYGRAYRRALYGQWGVADVADCINGARWLAREGRVNGEQLLISGSSAGGYTVLCALCFSDAFAAGASYYGISDLSALAQDTHKFESRYTEALVGPWPDARELYEARSPIHHIAGFNCPVIFFQGGRDRIVPPDQARRVVDALREAGVQTQYLLFEDEGHGFRQAVTQIQALEAECRFYLRALGLDPGT